MEINVRHVYLHAKIVVHHQFVKLVSINIILIQDLVQLVFLLVKIVQVKLFVNHVLLDII